MKPKILIIGLDAATMDLIEPWSEAGKLPAISSVMREGVSSRFLSTPNMHSASAWTSILTGLNPGRHGLYVFSDRDFATGRQLFFKGGDREGELITSHLARHGMTSGLLNVPMTYPASCAPGGYTVSGLDAPSLGEKAFCPVELRGDILTRFPDYNFAPAGIGDLMSAGRIAEAIDEWKRLIEAQTRAALHLMEARPVDFFMTVYTASDWGGHNLWKYTQVEPYSTGGQSNRSNDFGDALLSIYSALDRAVGQLIERAGEGAQVYIISDHGMGSHSGASYHLASWLEEKGYMARKSRGQSRAAWMSAGRRAAKKILPAAVKEKLKSSLSAEAVKGLQAAEKDSFYDSIDWEKTVAYAEAGRHVININLSGRNKSGR
ncbi:MAG TPA: alkaline phosphatase family protein, partial [Blastocatellia bacterium]|nr:alkaline phosphatase family protein [Blastocatellia bacterium]